VNRYSETDQSCLDLIGVSGKRVPKAIATDEKVRAQQSRITLLKIEGADWLAFTDRHRLLWRHSS
jgi:hypothetical protein